MCINALKIYFKTPIENNNVRSLRLIYTVDYGSNIILFVGKEDNIKYANSILVKIMDQFIKFNL